jgi:hypothetical protein
VSFAFAKSMKCVYEFITKANQVLLFVVIIGGAAWFSYLIYEEVSRKYEPPHVSVAQTPDEMGRSNVDDVRFLGQSSDVYMFGVVKRVVAPNEDRSVRIRRVDYLGEYRESGEIVNVVFVKGDKPVKTLLPSDGLVLSHYVSGEYRSEKLQPLLFVCVREDTDGNHRLDRNDRNDLYVISDNLEHPDMLIEGLLDFHVTSPTSLVVKTGASDAPQFWEIDVDAQTKRELIWK